VTIFMHLTAEVGDTVLPLVHHGRWELVRIEGGDGVIKLRGTKLETCEPEDLGYFITVPLSTLRVFKKGVSRL
jgi:hypothetical protein